MTILNCTWTWDDISDFFEERQIKTSEYEIIENERKKKNENKILRKVVEK